MSRRARARRNGFEVRVYAPDPLRHWRRVKTLHRDTPAGAERTARRATESPETPRAAVFRVERDRSRTRLLTVGVA